MAYKGKVQLTLVIVAPADQVAEGDRLFQAHGPWMNATHHRTGEKALLSYTLSKAQEVTNPMDSGSAPTGNTVFVLMEIYETAAGVAEHFALSGDWKEFPAVAAWMGKCKVTGVTVAPIINSLW